MKYIAQVFQKLVGVSWEALQFGGCQETSGLGGPPDLENRVFPAYYIPTFSPHLSKPLQASDCLLFPQQQRAREE